MRNRTLFALAFSGTLLASCDFDLDHVLPPVDGSTEDQVVQGLRTALSVGIDTSASFAGKVDGYLASSAIKILLPDEAKQAIQSAETVGSYVNPFAHELQAIKAGVQLAGLDKGEYATNLVRATDILNEVASVDDLSDSLVKYMNRAAEKAAPRSVPIFKSAITSMTIDDGLSLLNSSDSTAATGYLNAKTFAPLTTAYAPLVDSTLALVPLTKYWTDFRTTYNALLADYQKLVDFQTSWNANPVVSLSSSLQVDALKPAAYQPIKTESLGAWTTEHALTGLFYLVGEQEKDIRRDPFGYVKHLAGGVADILSKVFGDIMQMQDPAKP